MLAEIKLERLCRLEKKSPLSAHEGFQLIEDLIPFRYESEISDFNDKLKNNAEMSKLFVSILLIEKNFFTLSYILQTNNS